MAEVGQRVRLPDGRQGRVIGHRGDVVIVSLDSDHETEEWEGRHLTPVFPPRKGQRG